MQPGSYCRIIDARCAQLKIFLKKNSKKRRRMHQHQQQQQPSAFSFVRSGRMALFCWRPLVRFNRLEQTAKKKKKKKKRLDCKCFPALCYLSIWERFFRSLYSHSPSVFTLLFDRPHRTFFNKNVFLQQLQ